MMKVPKRRNCKVCGQSFKPVKIMDWACCEDHQVEYAISIITKNREKQRKSAEALRRSERGRERKEIKQRKFAVSTPQKQASEAQAAFNSYIRARDFGNPCISCGCEMDWHNNGSLTGGAVDAGHYRTVKAAKHLRFNTFNNNAQCVACNRFRSGAQTDYRIGLIEKYGIEKVEELESDNRVANFNADYYARIKKIFTKRANRLKKKIRGATFAL